MNDQIITQNEKIAFLHNPNEMLSKEQALALTDEIITDGKRLKLNILVLKINRGYEALGYTTFKQYVIEKLNLTYDAVIKQMIAANAAIRLFGPTKVGFYSDSSMHTLNAIHFEFQVKVIIKLKEKFKKEIHEDLTPQELTKKNVDEAFKEIDPKQFKLLQSVLGAEFKDEGFSSSKIDVSSEMFEIADEEAFFAKHGFSRWDERSLKLLKADKLKNLTEKALINELTFNWNLIEMLAHVKTYHSESLSASMAAGLSSHDNLVRFLVNVYHSESDTSDCSGSDCANANDNFASEEDESTAENNEFFSDATDSETKAKFNKMRRKLKKSLFRNIDEKYRDKNPMAAALMVIADDLDDDELEFAKHYFDEKYENLYENPEDEDDEEDEDEDDEEDEDEDDEEDEDEDDEEDEDEDDDEDEDEDGEDEDGEDDEDDDDDEDEDDEEDDDDDEDKHPEGIGSGGRKVIH
jgi:hypothetical protein